MTPEKEVLRQIILVLKINRLIEAKNLAVRYQKFEDAVKFRDQEVALEKQIMSIEQLEDLEKQLL